MNEEQPATSADYVAEYLLGVLKARTVPEETPEGQPAGTRGAGHVVPSFWADAPWRLEPGQTEIPFTFIVRDAGGLNLKVKLEEIVICEAADDGLPWEEKDWRVVHRFTEGLGTITRLLWAYRPSPSLPLGPPPTIPLSQFQTAEPGGRLLLKAGFKGKRRQILPIWKPFEDWQGLVVRLASDSLPLRDSTQWYYGDTHYHSTYTNDVKEYGNPVPDTRAAAEAIGLDWLVITDHSVDLADENPYWEDRLSGGSRWDDLGLEVQASSDDRFRLLRGEELTILGRPGLGDDTLHMLVFGDQFDKLIPGAFARKGMLSSVADRLLGFARHLYEHLFGEIYKLEAVLTGVDQTGQAVPALQGRSVQDQGALAFAAHPASMAQAPGGTWDFYDLVQPIHGMEAWNTRLRHYANEEDSPFEDWEESKSWEEGANKKGIEAWDRILRQKVGLADPRYILLAGSDAHGSFNFSEGWWVDWDGFRADDNCLGRVRTLLYLPHRDPAGTRQSPTEAEVADAIRTGSCVLTDGPVLNVTLGCNGSRAKLGEILTVDGEGTLEVDVQAASTAEFGQVEQVEVTYYFRGMDDAVPAPVPFNVGHSEVVGGDLPSGPGYVRLATVTRNGQETYRCFTNPIWVKSAVAGERRLRVNCVGW
jgi:hypothetical protein